MTVLTKTEIIDELKRIGLNDPPDISSHLIEYRKYCIRENILKKHHLIKKLLKCLPMLISPFLYLVGRP